MANEIDFKKLEKEIENATKQTKNFTEELKDLTRELSSLSSSGSSSGFTGGMASTISDFQTIAESIADTISAVGELSSTISNLGSSSSSSISGIANSFSNIPGAIGSVIGIVTSIGTAIYDVYQTCIENDINEHFGNITLSAQQLKQAAEDLTSTTWDFKINAVLSASTQVETLQTNLQENVSQIDQYNWKVGIGLTLTDEEKQDYKKTVEDYVSNLSGYLSQQWYTTNLAVNVLFGNGSSTGASIQQQTNSAFQGMNSKLASLGQELNQMVADALGNNTISDPNVQNAINNKMQEIQEVVDHVADTKYRVKIDKISADIAKGGLTQESFSGLQQELNTALTEKKQELDNTEIEALVGLELQLESNEINQQEYEDLKEQIQLNASNNLGDVTLDTVKLQIQGFEQVWGEELENGKTQFENGISDWLDYVDFDSYNITNQLNHATLQNKFSSGISASLKKSIEQLLKDLEPQTSTLESLAKSYNDMGQSIPKWILDGLAETYELKSLTGDMDAQYQYMAYQIVQDSDSFESLKETLKNDDDAFAGMDPRLISGLEFFGGGKFDSEGVWRSLADYSEASIPEIIERFQDQGLLISEAVAGSIAELSPGMQEQAMNLINSFTFADDPKKREEILGQLAELGIAMDSSLAQGVYENLGFVQEAGSDTITAFNTATGERFGTVTPEFVQNLKNMGYTGLLGMNEVINGNPLDAPNLDDVDAVEWAKEAKKSLQGQLDQTTLVVKVKTAMDVHRSNTTGSWTTAIAPQDFLGYASGGFVDKEQLSWIAEGDKPEVVIPLDPGKRTRAMQLFAQTSELLGVSVQARNGFPLGDSLSPSTSVVDYSRLAALITDSLKSSTIQCNPVFQVSQGDVYLDSEKAGRALTPVISRIQAKTAKFETR